MPSVLKVVFPRYGRSFSDTVAAEPKSAIITSAEFVRLSREILPKPPVSTRLYRYCRRG